MSNGVWVSSAWVAMRKSPKPTNWVKTYGSGSHEMPKTSVSAWARTMPWRLNVPAWMTTPTTASTRGSS
jgi:hypothetical protein